MPVGASCPRSAAFLSILSARAQSSWIPADGPLFSAQQTPASCRSMMHQRTLAQCGTAEIQPFLSASRVQSLMQHVLLALRRGSPFCLSASRTRGFYPTPSSSPFLSHTSILAVRFRRSSLIPFLYTHTTLNCTPSVSQLQLIESVNDNGSYSNLPLQETVTVLPVGARLLALLNGVAIASVAGAGLISISLKTHAALHAANAAVNALHDGRVRDHFRAAFSLGRLDVAANVAHQLKDSNLWCAIAAKSMDTLDVRYEALLGVVF